MSYQDVMGMPLRAFWSFNAQVSRLRAEENLAAMELHMLGGFGTSGEMIDKVRASFLTQMADPMVEAAPKKTDAQISKEGAAKLRALAAGLKPSVDQQPQP